VLQLLKQIITLKQQRNTIKTDLVKIGHDDYKNTSRREKTVTTLAPWDSW
jgi:hypothetical protein